MTNPTAPSPPVVALAQRLAKIEVQSFCAPGVDVVWKTINASLSEDERDLIVAALASRPAPAVEPTQGEIDAAAKAAWPFINPHDEWESNHNYSQKTNLIEAMKAALIAALTSRPAPSATAFDPKTVEACAKVAWSKGSGGIAEAIRALIGADK